MANPVVTTVELQEENITNSSLYFLGSIVKNGWEVTAWGFWWYKTSSGVGAQAYIASSSDFDLNDFLKFSGSKNPYTSYTFRARIYARKWNAENEEYDYIEVFGDWEEVTTHAYCYPAQAFACNINKSTGAVTFHSAVEDNDGGNCVERGFEYGNTRTASWSVKEEGNFAEEGFSLLATGLALNQDFYVRPYCKSVSGHVFYYGMVTAEDEWLGGWRKFTTKDLNREWCALFNGGYIGDSYTVYEYLAVFDENGQEVDCFPLGAGHDAYQVTVDSNGVAFLGDIYGGTYRIRYMNLTTGNGSSLTVAAHVKGISIGKDGHVYSIEGTTLYKRVATTLEVVTSIALAQTAYAGLTLDEDGYLYTIETSGTDRLEKYAFYPSYNISSLVAYETHAITNIGFKYFEVSGDYTSLFTEGIGVVVEGSANNNGTYTVSPAGSTCFGGITRINVDEDVPSEIADGTLRRYGVQGFKIADDYASEFSEGATVIVKASTGNNGTYTVITGGAVYASNYTTIRVNEAIPDLTEDGVIIQQEGGTFEAYVYSPVSLNWGSLAVIGDNVYAGAFFDYPVKAPKDLSSCAIWYPAGDEWYHLDWWFDLSVYKGKILLEGSSDDALNYSRAIALYDSDENLLWFEPMVAGVDGLGGYPFQVGEITTQAPTQVDEHGQPYYDCAMGNGTIVSGENITERGFEIKVAVDFFGVGPYVWWHLIGFIDVGDIVTDMGQWTGTLTKTETWTGEFEVGAFEGVLGHANVFGNPSAIFNDALKECTSYTYRAYMKIGDEYLYGEYVAFDTPCYPLGHADDNVIPITDIIPIEPPLIIPEELAPFYVEPEFPPFEFPEFEWPEFTYPEMPAYNGSWLGWFYYRKAYTKRDLEELRKKCRIFQDNSVEYALVVNHNSRVLQQFLNTMTDYMDADEYNTFKPIIPTQHLNALAREPLNIIDFKKMINNFISNGIDNANNVNHNFLLIRNGLGDYAYTEDEGFKDISITTNLVNDNNPDVDRLKKVVDRLNKEMANNYNIINHNLHILRAILI